MSLSNYDLVDIAKDSKIPLDFVVSKDELLLPGYLVKFKQAKNWNIIINLQDLIAEDGTQNEGSHWVSLLRVDDYFIYVDSYGFTFPNEVMELAKKLGIKKIYYSDKHIQRVNTSICGYYALFFIHYIRYYLSKQMKIPRIIELLGNEFGQPIDNIKIFKSLLSRYF